MKYTKILYLSIIMGLTYLLYSRDVFAKSQTFDPVTIPQTIINTPRYGNACFKNSSYVFYDKQSANFYNTFTADKIDRTMRIINTATGQNDIYYYAGAPDSSKELIYNPFGSLSNSKSFVGKNTFVPNFIWKSAIKPANIETVYVARQISNTYFIGGSGSIRNQIAGQIVHNIWVRAPYNTTNGGLSYSYLEFPSQTVGTKQLTLTRSTNTGWNRTDYNKYLCNNIYIAKCGDKILDNTLQTGGANTNGKQGIQTVDGFLSWTFPTTFTGEVCDSHNLSGAACENGTVGCCNLACDGYVSTGSNVGICGDGIWNADGLDGISGNQDDEKCDLGPWNETTQIGNNDSYRLSPCATYCEINPEPETLPEELG